MFSGKKNSTPDAPAQKVNELDAQIYKVDKSAWGEGPWQHEPDRAEWEHAGLPCLAVRGPHGGWCGYAAVDPSHPLYQKYYDDVDVEVHGGLTYANKCQGHICHVPKPGKSKHVWWFGFDCAHSGDFSPSYGNRYVGQGYPWPEKPYDHATAIAANDWRVDRYRDLAYVEGETCRLAEQLAKLAEGR